MSANGTWASVLLKEGPLVTEHAKCFSTRTRVFYLGMFRINMFGIRLFATEFWTIRNSKPDRGKRFFYSPQQTDLGSTQPLIQRLPGVNLPRCEADHSPPPDIEVKNKWS